jgi:hypothetical protein
MMLLPKPEEFGNLPMEPIRSHRSGLDSLVASKLHVKLQEDTTKRGEKELTVIEQTLRIVMEGERKVEPRNLTGASNPPGPADRNKKEFKIELTRNKAPVVGHSFQLTNNYVDSTGGHDHLAPGRARNRDNYGWFILKRTNTEHDSPYNGQTQDNGKEIFDYVASVFGDRIRLRVESTEPNKRQFLWDTVSITEKVDSLIAFPQTANYSLTGRKPAHPNNHYFYQIAVDSLVKAANEFAKAEWNTSGKMLLNDMSLEWGGLFDINGSWGTPHSLHRVGRSVDIENLVMVSIDTVDQKTGKETKLTVPKVEWVRDFVRFMETKMGNWQFIDEGQAQPDIFKRTRKYPHFEWKGR